MKTPNPREPSTEELRRRLPAGFCPLPFTQLFLYPTGEVFTCCEIGYPLGRIQEQSLAEIWNNEKTRRLREEFLSGDIRICAEPIRLKGCNRANESLLSLVDPAVRQKEPVKAFDLILNGRCNLECVMCPIWELPNGTFDATSFWREGEKGLFARLKYIHVKSGEPFVQRDTYRLIRAVSAVNPGCRWRLTTNGHYRLTPYVLEHLDRIVLDRLAVSVDSLDPAHYARIRRKGELSLVLGTLESYSAYAKRRAAQGRGFLLLVNMAVQKSNWREVPAMLAFALSQGAYPAFLYVFEPGRESLDSLPLQERRAALDLYLDLLKKDPGAYPCLQTLLAPLLEGLPAKARPAYLERRDKALVSALLESRRRERLTPRAASPGKS